MKRYRVFGMDFDFRANLLKTDIDPNWEEHVKVLNRRNQMNVVAGLVNEYGSLGFDEKIDNFVEFGPLPFSVIAFHNKFLRQVRVAFVSGAYYPALTGACALGERILNHLLILLRGYYRNTPEYKEVYAKESFQNWKGAIDTLAAWQVILPDVVDSYRNLAAVRNDAIHFRPETDQNDRLLALEAIRLLSDIIGNQFSAFGTQPWFIPGIRGASFITKEAEQQPFVKEIYIQSQNCLLVGPFHKVTTDTDADGHIRFHVADDHLYDDREILDQEFVELLNDARQG
jgi:hypothetical protein